MIQTSKRSKMVQNYVFKLYDLKSPAQYPRGWKEIYLTYDHLCLPIRRFLCSPETLPLWTWLISVQKISFLPSIDFQFSIFIFFPFQEPFLWAEALHYNAFMVCYSVDRRADTIYLQTDAIAIRWEKSKETITMFYRKHRQVLRRKIPNIFLQGKPK